MTTTLTTLAHHKIQPRLLVSHRLLDLAAQRADEAARVLYHADLVSRRCTECVGDEPAFRPCQRLLQSVGRRPLNVKRPAQLEGVEVIGT